METYFLRQGRTLDIDMPTRLRLWHEDKVAIHFPHVHGIIGATDTTSLDPEDYLDNRATGGGRRAMGVLRDLCTGGGYVWADCYPFPESLLGYVEPGTPIELFRGVWGDVYGNSGREAILKAVPLTKAKRVLACAYPELRNCRPPFGTLFHWPKAVDRVARIVESR